MEALHHQTHRHHHHHVLVTFVTVLAVLFSCYCMLLPLFSMNGTRKDGAKPCGKGAAASKRNVFARRFLLHPKQKGGGEGVAGPVSLGVNCNPLS